MTAAPETGYTRSADGTNLAYQVSGKGQLDLVFLPSGVPIDLLSEDPGFFRLRTRLGNFSRTVWFDARGWRSEAGNPAPTGDEIAEADLWKNPGCGRGLRSQQVPDDAGPA
jgi:hypothetical protein